MLGIVCGLAREAQIAKKYFPHAIVVCAAAQPDKATTLAQDLITQGATKLMSFGLAGGLNPILGEGDVVLGIGVNTAQNILWNAVLPPVNIENIYVGMIYGSDSAIATPADKKALHQKTHCLAVDMESHRVGAVACEKQIPFYVVRVIVDGAGDRLSQVAQAPIQDNGNPDIRKILTVVWNNPRQEVPALVRLWRQSNKAFASLNRIARIIASSV